jgi:hypothetical protein
LGPKLHAAAAAFDEFARGVMDKLNALDGKTVDVWINTHERGAVGEHGGSGVGTGNTVLGVGVSGGSHQAQEFAGGGMVDGPPGSPQWALVHGGERVLTPEQQRASGGDVIGLLRVVHETPDGRVLREELLALKRRGGLTSLGLT